MRITKRAVARWTIAAVAGAVVATLAAYAESYYSLLNVLAMTILKPSPQFVFDWSSRLLLQVILLMPFALLGCLVAISVYRRILRLKDDGECRCRKCGYILKGISKPECSECGEVI